MWRDPTLFWRVVVDRWPIGHPQREVIVNSVFHSKPRVDEVITQHVNLGRTVWVQTVSRAARMPISEVRITHPIGAGV